MVTYDVVENASVSDLEEAIESELAVHKAAIAILGCELASGQQREEAGLVKTLTSLRVELIREELSKRQGQHQPSLPLLLNPEIDSKHGR